MQFQVNVAEIKRAQVPHNLFVTGLFLFDLSMTPAVIVLKLGMLGLLLPLLCSGALLAYIYVRSQKNSIWFVDAHWRLSFKHARWLLLGYAASALLIFVAWLISQSAHEASMKHILWTALTRIALMPTLIAVMVTAVMEASAIGLASKGEVPDKIASAFPPPNN
ncbi:MAG: hypothetical protein WCD45_06995 [Gallionella sp.]